MKRFLTGKSRTRLVNFGKWTGGRAAAVAHRAFGDRARGRFGILLYHRVTPNEGDIAPDSVTPERFREQLEGLLERGFQFAPLTAVIAARQTGEPLPPRTVVVTFDDGFANVYRCAWPILKDLRIPATVFVVTAHVGSREPFPFDPWGMRHQSAAPPVMWRPLDWTACRELEASGLIDIGSHTHTHADFRGRADAFEGDVRRSFELLEEQLGPGRRPFAFPFGTVRAGFAGPELAAAARRAEATCALTTEIQLADPNGDPYAWGRFEADQSDSGSTCAAKLAGWYDWMGATRSVFQRISTR